MMDILGTLGRLFSLLTIPLTGLTIWGLIRQTRKEQRLSLASPVIGLAMAPMTLLINIVFLHQAFQQYLGPAMLIFGLGLGLAWGQTTRMYAKGKRLVGKRSIMHLVFWGISYAITQVLATFAPAFVVAGGLATMFFSTGSTLGTNLNILARQLQMRPALAMAGSPAALPETPRAVPPPAIGLPESGRPVPPPKLPEQTAASSNEIPSFLPK
jgi:hypothetical protein